MSVWRRAIAWLRGEPPLHALEDAGEVDAAPTPEPVVLRPPEESWLSTLVTEASEGQRVDEVASETFWDKVHTLWNEGHERLAVQWLEKFLAVPTVAEETRARLRAELSERQVELGESADAVPHLERLADSEDTAVRAHYLLAEHYRRTGDEARALRHYEAVLSRDVDYPNVRARFDRLRAGRGDEPHAAVGDTLVGATPIAGSGGARYQLVRELGRGASGAVYLARDTELERDVAVKLLHPHLSGADRAEACARFFDEARAAASLRHPNIIAVLDLDEGARRLVMELAAGGTLQQVLRERGPRPLRRALERHAQILSALGTAHRRGIVHRDLKPANLMFRRDPDAPGAEVVLADFGVAHLPDAEGATREDAAGRLRARADSPKRAAEAVGTLAYMAPEQRRGAGADPSADLYASAVVLFEMLTGRYPWPRDVLLSGARTADDFALPGEVTAGAPAELRTRLERHLAALGSPAQDDRPGPEDAAAEALALRDLAVASAG